jgi:cobalamin biosynthesis protein CobD/CbiB
MNKTLINNPYRNPFHNRFHVPVSSRLDEMQSYTHPVWLSGQTRSKQKTGRRQDSRIPALAGAFALVLIVAVSAVMVARFSF